jgi:hypothetical protein
VAIELFVGVESIFHCPFAVVIYTLFKIFGSEEGGVFAHLTAS